MSGRFGRSDKITEASEILTLALGSTTAAVTGTTHEPVSLDSSVEDLFSISPLQVISADGATTQGDLIYSDSDDNWTRLAIGDAYKFLGVNSGGTDPEWQAFDWDNVAGVSGAYMEHDHSSTTLGGEVSLTGLADYAQGRVIVGGSANWEVLAPCASDTYLRSDGASLNWAAGTGGVSDHGALTGLTDSDHPQYFLLAGSNVTAKLYSGADLELYSDAGTTRVGRWSGCDGAVEVVSGTYFGISASGTRLQMNASGNTLDLYNGLNMRLYADAGSSQYGDWNAANGNLTVYYGDLVLNNGAEAKLSLRSSGAVSTTEADIYADASGGLAADDNVYIFIDADNGATTSFFAVQKDAENAAAATEVFRVNESPWMGLNETSNACVVVGMTINQGANDTEIMAFKSSDVAHGVTSIAETDTYGSISKWSGDIGGMRMVGITETAIGAVLTGIGGSDSANQNSSANAYIILQAAKSSGSSIGAVGTNANLVVIRDYTTTTFCFDKEGSAHAEVEWTTFDEYDDVALLSDLEEALLANQDPVKEGFSDFLRYNRDALERARIVNFGDNGKAMVNFTRLSMLLVGAVRQLGDRLALVEGRGPPGLPGTAGGVYELRT